VNTPAEFESSYVSKEKIKSFVEDFDVEKFTVNVYNDSSVVNGILHFSQEINADIIALNTHGRSGLSTLFNGSVTKSLSKNAMRPVVTFRL
jgi:nucleotide-binding universal stress UspA family protein